MVDQAGGDAHNMTGATPFHHLDDSLGDVDVNLGHEAGELGQPAEVAAFVRLVKRAIEVALAA